MAVEGLPSVYEDFHYFFLVARKNEALVSPLEGDEFQSIETCKSYGRTQAFQ